ncbi:AMP-binding protein [Pseudomonas sp. SBB6]|uniref:AMP-binding protein n=1 Tax=Pseudomonas sp. SBB6 TaxID=2962032 RepID=UPI0020B8D877|nr:AMP-binding protein [Pseudomonas sp. SBB6]MCP3750573.1 long-chain fatty acid--CoA ligase [Pseudomonas sp. SBB6]
MRPFHHYVKNHAELTPEKVVLVVAGELVMLGYWNQPELTRRVLRNDLFGEARVYFTGDLFRMDSEQYLYFVDRTELPHSYSDALTTNGQSTG